MRCRSGRRTFRRSAVFEAKPMGGIRESKNQFQKMLEGSTPVLKNSINFTEGDAHQTENTTDFAIQGKGFFELKAPTGEMVYTRNGQFNFNAQGVLVSKEGYEVQSDGGSINVQNNGQSVRITEKGIIFQGNQQIEQTAGGFSLPKDGTASASLIEEPKVLQGYLENSNISAIKSMTNLIQASHLFEANQKVISTFDADETQAIQILGTIR